MEKEVKKKEVKKELPKKLMRLNVIHNGEKFSKDEQVPEKFLEFFTKQGFVKEAK